MWPIFLLQSALMAAASTIKNPNSKNALLLKATLKALFDQAKAVWPDDFK
jgi:hypothetical protein